MVPATFPSPTRRRILGTEAIKWNFTKFLVGSDGTVLRRYAPSDKPEVIAAAEEKGVRNHFRGAWRAGSLLLPSSFPDFRVRGYPADYSSRILALY